MAAWSVGGIRKATTRRRAGPEQNSLARACPLRATRRDWRAGVCFTLRAAHNTHACSLGGKRTVSLCLGFFWERGWAEKHNSREGLI